MTDGIAKFDCFESVTLLMYEQKSSEVILLLVQNVKSSICENKPVIIFFKVISQ